MKKISENEILLFNKKTSSGNYNVICSQNSIKLKEDYLNLGYAVSFNIFYFKYYWRRRDNEQISIASAYCEIALTEDELKQFRIFQERYKLSKTPSDELLGKINEDRRLMVALLEKFEHKVGGSVLKGTEREIPRVCAVDKAQCCKNLNKYFKTAINDMLQEDFDTVMYHI